MGMDSVIGTAKRWKWIGNVKVHEHERETYLVTGGMWGVFVGGAAICPDGKLRKLSRIAPCADSCWTIPASVKYKGKTVSGYLCHSGLTSCGPTYIEFR